ncbi:unnamed protein product [Anisakis simplex]|uniref:Protein RALF-like 34 n=1 Tax=Anisakis simplex TaxID=6269 RepID=A0A0M3K331_ANISI|nr:unnamed protein product [Anisakis simplex]
MLINGVMYLSEWFQWTCEDEKERVMQMQLNIRLIVLIASVIVMVRCWKEDDEEIPLGLQVADRRNAYDFRLPYYLNPEVSDD